MSTEDNQAKTTPPQEETPVKKEPPRVPLLLDVSLSISQTAIIVLGCAVALVSLFAKADLVMIALRSGAAMLSVGLLMWLFNWFLSRNSLEIARQELLSEMEAADEDRGESTVEKKA